MACTVCGSEYSSTAYWIGIDRVCFQCWQELNGVIATQPSSPSDRKKVASDGRSTDYYRLPEHATELRHLVSHKGMSFSRGNLFKACYRLGEKEGVDILYDLNKMMFFIEDLIEMHERGEMV